MSYYPEILLKKYVAVSSDVIFADKERNREEIHKIWETCFGDEAELVDFYLDKRMTEDNMSPSVRMGMRFPWQAF